MDNKDVIAFNCSKCHELVARYTENDFERLYKKGLCKKCLKNLKNNSVSDVKSCYNKYCDYNCDGECRGKKKYIKELKRRNCSGC